MVECHGIGFTEVVRCDFEDGFKIAHGWTQSTGRDGAFPYHPPAGWKYDPQYGDIRGGSGSHGGCSDCFMTCVHLISTEPEPDPCEGVTCDPECYGVDKHETTCEEGICIKGILMESDSVECGYTPPDPEPEPDPESDEAMDLIPILIIGVILYIIIKR